MSPQACAVSLIVLLSGASARAQEATLPLANGADPISLPSIGRVLFAFVIAAGLALAVAVTLRRLAPKLRGSMLAATGNLRVLERVHLGADLRMHLVQTEHGRVLITAHRNSIAVVVLDSSAQDAPRS